MTTQIFNAEMVDLLRSNFPDRQRYAKFAYNVNAQWYDYPLNDPDNGTHFNDNTSAYPTEWTEVDAALDTNTNNQYGFWYLAGGTDTSWKYRKQLTYNIEADSVDGAWISFLWGPIVYRDTQNPNDEVYRFGLYADNGGSIDEDTYIRSVLHWSASLGLWRVRGERKDGTTQTNGSWFTVSQFPNVQPLFFRNTLRYFAAGTNERVRAYVGATPLATSHTSLMNDVMNDTWGQVWIQAHMDRGADGVQNYLFIGAVDRNDEA